MAAAAHLAAKAILLCVPDEYISLVMMTLVGGCNPKQPFHSRLNCAKLVGDFCKESKLDLDDNLPQMLQCLIGLYHAEEQEVLRAAWASTDTLVKTIPKEKQSAHVTWVRDQLRFASLGSPSSANITTVATIVAT